MDLALVGGLILVALLFDYINGFHDAANSIATVVSTRVLTPGKAVAWAAFFNFAAAFLAGTAAAQTGGAGVAALERAARPFCGGGRWRRGWAPGWWTSPSSASP